METVKCFGCPSVVVGLPSILEIVERKTLTLISNNSQITISRKLSFLELLNTILGSTNLGSIPRNKCSLARS